MKKTLFALMGAVLFALPAFALVGGPWDNNIPGNPFLVNPANVDGTYQGTIKGKNLSGVMRFISVVNKGRVVYSDSDAVNIAASGIASFFFEGRVGMSVMDVIVDVGGRKLAGVVEGSAIRGVEVRLIRPADDQTWTLKDNAYFNGAFSAKFKSWPSTNFNGKGSLTVTKFDYIGFWQDLVSNPTTAVPYNHIVTVPMSIKVAGTKVSDNTAEFDLPVINNNLPDIF